MPLSFARVVIVGVGLLGGSLGLALRDKRIAGEIVGVGRRAASLKQAHTRGAIDRYSLDLADAAHDADLVVICTPAQQAIADLDILRSAARPDAIITDVASTKAALCAHADATWPSPRRFVGSHPMAGSEKFGPEHARADLYQGAVCLVEDSAHCDAAARAAVQALWEALGMRVVPIDAALHDAVLARTSHLPHIVAAALALLAARSGDVSALAGPGFRDTTRVAEGRPELWRDISLTNRAALRQSIDELTRLLGDVAALLDREDEAALEHFFAEGVRARHAVLGAARNHDA